MYIDLVHRILEQAVDQYAADTGQTVTDVLSQIRQQIDATQQQHWNNLPQINYHDPLCRLGYLYRHATANATLFELVLRNSGELRQRVRAAHCGLLTVCTVGGGPGTELLGLVKYLLLRCSEIPQKIHFTVLDNIPHWAETWGQLSEEAETELRAACVAHATQPPTIQSNFLPLDVVDPHSYGGYAFQFRKTDIIVSNYLFSENKTRLREAQLAVQHLAAAVPRGCAFVVIDRLERDPTFKNQVVTLFESVFGTGVAVHTFAGTLDYDEQTSDMGAMIMQILGVPRVKFFTEINRDPTVFWFVVLKP